MNLKDITIPSEPVSVGDQSFDVHGIGVQAIVELLQMHPGVVESLFDLLMSDEGDEGEGIQPDNIASLVLQYGGFFTDMIALSAHDKESCNVVRQLPLGVQVNALISIYKLTLDSVGGVKKLLPLLLGTVKAANASLKEITA